MMDKVCFNCDDEIEGDYYVYNGNDHCCDECLIEQLMDDNIVDERTYYNEI